MKRILIISKSFYPLNSPRSFRTTELAKEFSLRGYDVEVLLPNKQEIHNNFEIKHSLKIIDLGKINFNTINSRIKLLNRFLNRFLNLILDYPDIKILPKVLSFLKKNNNYDVIISIAVPHPIHWAVAFYKLKSKSKINWIADCGDPYMGCETDTFKKLFYFKYLEQLFCKHANYITVPFKGAINSYYSEFRDKIKVIPQGFKFFENSVQNEKIIKKDKSPISFIYAGGFIPNFRDPSSFLEYLASVTKDFVFIIYTNNDMLVNKYRPILKNKLEVRSYIPREALFEKFMEADFLVNFDNNIAGQLPSKLIDYGMTGKPVINIKKDIDKNSIDKFLDKNYFNAMKIENLNDYRIENVVSKFEKLF